MSLTRILSAMFHRTEQYLLRISILHLASLGEFHCGSILQFSKTVDGLKTILIRGMRGQGRNRKQLTRCWMFWILVQPPCGTARKQLCGVWTLRVANAAYDFWLQSTEYYTIFLTRSLRQVSQFNKMSTRTERKWKPCTWPAKIHCAWIMYCRNEQGLFLHDKGRILSNLRNFAYKIKHSV